MNKSRLFALIALTAVLMLSIGVGAQIMQEPEKGPETERGWMDRGPGKMEAGMRPGMGRRWGHGRMAPGMRPGMGPGMRGRMQDRIDFYLSQGDRLDLSKEQIAQLRDLKFAFEKASVKRHADLQTAMIELQQLRSAESVDAKKVESQIREVFSKRAELAVAAFKAQTEAGKVLTDEQRAQAKSPWKGDRMRRPGRANKPDDQNR